MEQVYSESVTSMVEIQVQSFIKRRHMQDIDIVSRHPNTRIAGIWLIFQRGKPKISGFFVKFQ